MDGGKRRGARRSGDGSPTRTGKCCKPRTGSLPVSYSGLTVDGTWNVDGTDIGDGEGWNTRKEAMEEAAQVLGEFEVVS